MRFDVAAIAAHARSDVRWASGAPASTDSRTATFEAEIERCATILALRVHPCEPLERSLDQARRALSKGVAVLWVGDAFGTGAARRAAEEIARACGWTAASLERVRPSAVGFVEDEGLDVVRAIAEHPRVALDVVTADSFATGLAITLDGIRQRASGSLDRAQTNGCGWFGVGIVAEPAAPVRVRTPNGRAMYVRGDSEGEGEGVAWTIEDLDGGAVEEGHGDTIADAASFAVEAAFGYDVLGGFAAHGVARVLVEPEVFAEFSTEFLDRLQGDVDAVPGWVLEGRDCAEGLGAARRIGLDEGGTLVFDQTIGRRRRSSTGGPAGWVFTNIEARMRLGSSLRALGGVVLMRAMQPHRRTDS